MKFFLFLLTTSIILAQERIPLKGKVLLKDTIDASINIINKSSKKVTITNEFKIFNINVKIGDTLIFSCAELNNIKLIITSDHLKSNIIEVIMDHKTHILNQVVINNYSDINSKSLKISSKNIKTLTPAERRLKTVKGKKVSLLKDNKINPLLVFTNLAVVLNTDGIINLINGYTNKLKKAVEIEKKESGIAFFETKYKEYLMINLKLSKLEIKQFLYFILEEEDIQMIINSENDTRIKFFLCNSFLKYKERKQSKY